MSNALAAVAACGEAGLDAGSVAAAMAGGGGVPGRFERIDAGQPFTVVVDYAHKPDAVRAALESLRPLTDGRLIVVLGAGGDRDPGKRPLMGDLAARLADVVVVTDDNPRRSTRPRSAPRSSRAPAPAPPEVLEEGDRRAAIATGARPRDPATSSSSQARGTRPVRRSTGWSIPSTTARWCASCWRCSHGRKSVTGRRRAASDSAAAYGIMAQRSGSRQKGRR